MSCSISAGLATGLPPAIEIKGPGERRLSFSAYAAAEPWMHLLISHGFAEHRGWYDHVARTFQAAGISTYTFDHFHHGTSSGKPGDVADYAEFSIGLRLALEQGVAPRRAAGLPLAVLGHSNGGLAALRTVGSLPAGSLDALVLSNPLLGLPRTMAKWGLLTARLVGLFNPGWMIRSPSLPQRLTSDPNLWPDYGRDPLRLRALSVRFFRQMAVLARSTGREVSCLEFPLLLLFGGQDAVVRQSATLGWYARVAAPSKHIITYPGLRHELFNETAWRKVVGDVVDWLQTLAPPKGV